MSKVSSNSPPVFRAKPDIDPFELYGAGGGDAMSEYNVGTFNDDHEDLESARVKLAILKAQDKVADSKDKTVVFDEADHDLQEIIALQSFRERPEIIGKFRFEFDKVKQTQSCPNSCSTRCFKLLVVFEKPYTSALIGYFSKNSG